MSRENWFARTQADAWAVVLDAQGKIAWRRSEVGGDPLVVVLTQAVSDSQLAGMREDGVSYLFAEEQEIDLAAALEALNQELGIRRLLLEGDGTASGALLQAGLVDELRLVIAPSVAFLFRAWRTPTLLDWAVMPGLGLVWASRMFCMARAYSLELASVVAPFEYTTLPINAAWGFLLWREAPAASTWAGALLTLLSGFYIVYRERREQTAAARGSMPPMVAPAQKET
ncbi:MAG TPA: dihydrofolate reductase family protein [Roseiflexaceae bacterium]|nr:dihydrofolate reductase family protein [Roseiflexaceae bacterium]